MSSGRGRGDFVAISLGTQGLPYDNAKTRATSSHQSPFRFWYRMSGSQKLCMILVLASLSVTAYSVLFDNNMHNGTDVSSNNNNNNNNNAFDDPREDRLPEDLRMEPQDVPSDHHDTNKRKRDAEVKRKLDEVLQKLKAENSNMQDVVDRAEESRARLEHARMEADQEPRQPRRQHHQSQHLKDRPKPAVSLVGHDEQQGEENEENEAGEDQQQEQPVVQAHGNVRHQQQQQHVVHHQEEHHNPVPPRHAASEQGTPPVPGQPYRFPQGEESKEYGPRNARQRAVVDAYKHAWKAYKAHAWGHDELLPISKSYSEWFHLGLTLVDGLDTMYLMGLTSEFAEAREWVANGLRLDQDVDVNLFECTIRVLGGFLSTYALSGDTLFLDKSKDLGERLYHAFNPSSGVPYSDVNLHTHNAHQPKWGPDSSTSEVSTIQLEFKYLSQVTGDRKFADRATEVMRHLDSLPKNDGLVPIFINAHNGRFSGNTITLGARGDSYYEYLLKQYIQTSKTEQLYSKMWLESLNGIQRHLIKKTPKEGLTYIAELIGNTISPKMDHLVCFMPGALALSYAHGFDYDHLTLAKELMKTCYEMYARMPTGLAPEIVHFHEYGSDEDMYVKPADEHNLLRPETVESLFILYRITKDPIYQEWGWKIFEAFEKHTKIPEGGYSSLHSVKNPSFRDKMESFFLGETLKYFFLLFGDDDHVVPLDKYVFNTEAHPLPIMPHAI